MKNNCTPKSKKLTERKKILFQKYTFLKDKIQLLEKILRGYSSVKATHILKICMLTSRSVKMLLTKALITVKSIRYLARFRTRYVRLSWLLRTRPLSKISIIRVLQMRDKIYLLSSKRKI